MGQRFLSAKRYRVITFQALDLRIVHEAQEARQRKTLATEVRPRPHGLPVPTTPQLPDPRPSADPKPAYNSAPAMDVADIRREYVLAGLSAGDLAADPFV